MHGFKLEDRLRGQFGLDCTFCWQTQRCGQSFTFYIVDERAPSALCSSEPDDAAFWASLGWTVPSTGAPKVSCLTAAPTICESVEIPFPTYGIAPGTDDEHSLLLAAANKKNTHTNRETLGDVAVLFQRACVVNPSGLTAYKRTLVELKVRLARIEGLSDASLEKFNQLSQFSKDLKAFLHVIDTHTAHFNIQHFNSASFLQSHVGIKSSGC